MEQFISVERAQQLLNEHIVQKEASIQPIEQCISLLLAENVISKNNVPGFIQSSMDGYAIAYSKSVRNYKIIGESKAGQQSNITLQDGEAVRIFTGAPLPQGADTVVMQEKVIVQDSFIQVIDDAIQKGDHVRPAGSEIPKDGVALEKGKILNAASIGVMASLGYQQISVISAPSVTIIVTGDEIKKPGEQCADGQVYDASSFSLSSILNKMGCRVNEIIYVKDDLPELTQVLKRSLTNSDLLLITGGVSVGNYDFTKQACEASDIQIVFHKIKQKPGKPILFGKHQNKPVFGLPGNPASVLTCFYQHVYPGIGRMMGQDLSLEYRHLPILHTYSKQQGLTHFLKACVDEKGATLLTGQESYKISSMAQANAFVVIGEAITEIEKGEIVPVQLIPM